MPSGNSYNQLNISVASEIASEPVTLTVFSNQPKDTSSSAHPTAGMGLFKGKRCHGLAH